MDVILCVRLCGVRLFNNVVMRQAGCSSAIVFLNWRQCQRSKPKEHEIVWILKLKLSELENVFHILAIKNIFCYIDLCGFVHYECVSHCVTHLHNHVSCALVTAVKARLWDEWFALVSHRNKSASLSQRKGKRETKMAWLHCLSAARPPRTGTNVSHPPPSCPSHICMQSFPRTEFGTRWKKRVDDAGHVRSSDWNTGDSWTLKEKLKHMKSVITVDIHKTSDYHKNHKISCWLALCESIGSRWVPAWSIW